MVAVMVMAIAAGSGSGCRGRLGIAGDARHVILISLDTSRADHFGFMGNPWIETPRLDALAAESVVFTDYMTVVPTTLASHASLFTGKYPHHHGTPRNGFTIHPDNDMLPEILLRRGFRTAGFIGSFALDRRFGFAQGFEVYDQQFDILVGDEGADQNQRRAAAVTDAALRYLDANPVPDRLFLFVHYFDPHRPYDPPDEFEALYEAGGPRAAGAVEGLADRPNLGLEKRTRYARFARRYAGEISYMDHHVGRLLDGLRERGLLDDSIVIVVSDHGEDFWEHTVHFNHGRSVYQTATHALCLFRLPHGRRGGVRVDGVVASIDVLPTLLYLLGIPEPPGMDGVAVELDRESPLARPRVRFAQATKPWAKVETDPRWANIRKSRSVREGNFKLIQTPYAGTEELYDLGTDPGEQRNLLRTPSTEISARAARLRRTLESWAASARPLPSSFDASQRDDTIERLRALGYVSGQ